MSYIDGIYYDFSQFNHPGGNDILDMFIKTPNTDLTMVFVSNHSKVFPHNKYKNLRLNNGYKKNEIIKKINNSLRKYQDYLELIQLVKLSKITSSPSSFYWIKCYSLILSNFYLNQRLYYHWSFNQAMILGFINALIGLNIQHDANHGSLSYNKTFNRIFGLSQNLIGGSRNSWINQHMVQHHVYTNILGKDPDTDGQGLIRLNKYSSRYQFHMLQFLYTLLGLPFFSYHILIIDTYECLIQGYNFDLMSKLLFIYFNIIYPYDGTLLRLIETQIPIMFTGAYLSFFFLLSHNFVGVKNDTNYSVSSSTFMKRQIESSCNFESPIFTYMNGGLNYQIEHHLFPRYHHSKYKDISALVKNMAKKYEYTYTHFPSLYQNLKSTVKHLFILGRN